MTPQFSFLHISSVNLQQTVYLKGKTLRNWLINNFKFIQFTISLTSMLEISLRPLPAPNHKGQQ